MSFDGDEWFAHLARELMREEARELREERDRIEREEARPGDELDPLRRAEYRAILNLLSLQESHTDPPTQDQWAYSEDGAVDLAEWR